MTKNERIAALEREVAELRRQMEEQQRPVYAVGTENPEYYEVVDPRRPWASKRYLIPTGAACIEEGTDD